MTENLFRLPAYGRVWILPQGILWSQSLEETRLSSAGSLQAPLGLVLELVERGEPIPPGTSLEMVAQFLERHGALARGPGPGGIASEASCFSRSLTPPPGQAWIVWEHFSFGELARRTEESFRQGFQELTHIFLGCSVNHSWIYRQRREDVCVQCLARRWLSNLHGPVGKLLTEARGAVRWAPGADPGAWAELLSRLELAPGNFIHAPLTSAASSGPAVSTPACGCGTDRPRLQPPGPLSLVTRLEPWVAPAGWSYYTASVTGQIRGTGSDWKAERAAERARGEALERYGASLPLPGEAYRELRPPQLFLPSQKTPYSNQPGGAWVPLYSLTGGSRRWFPSDMVGLGAFKQSLAPSLSHGLACATTLEKALTSALWEVVERDAVAVFWVRLAKGRGQPLTPLALSDRGRRACGDMQLEGEVWLVESLVGSCAVALVFDGQQRLASGSAAGPDSASSADKALGEALQNYLYLSRHAISDFPPSRRPRSFIEHANFYWHNPQLFPRQSLVPSPREVRPCHGVSPELLLEAGFRGYWCDLTSRDVAQLGCRVVRVIYPGLLSLPENHDHWTMGLRRWRLLNFGVDLPELPHPFA